MSGLRVIDVQLEMQVSSRGSSANCHNLPGAIQAYRNGLFAYNYSLKTHDERNIRESGRIATHAERRLRAFVNTGILGD